MCALQYQDMPCNLIGAETSYGCSGFCVQPTLFRQEEENHLEQQQSRLLGP